jgi:hypothetical protein
MHAKTPEMIPIYAKLVPMVSNRENKNPRIPEMIPIYAKL